EVFGVSTDTAENTFHAGVFVLREVCPAQRWDAEKRGKKNEPSWTPDEIERVLIDSFESPVRRPSLPARQKRVYSGKKKRHTLKSWLTDKSRRGVFQAWHAVPSLALSVTSRQVHDGKSP